MTEENLYSVFPTRSGWKSRDRNLNVVLSHQSYILKDFYSFTIKILHKTLFRIWRFYARFVL